MHITEKEENQLSQKDKYQYEKYKTKMRNKNYILSYTYVKSLNKMLVNSKRNSS